MKSRLCVVAVIERNGSILFGRKPENVGPYPNTWVLPGGGVDPENETIADALKREIMEETGIKIESATPLGFAEDYEPDKHGDMVHYVYLTYHVKTKSDKFRPGDDIVSLEWIPVKKIADIPLPRPSIELFKKLGYL